MQDPKEKQAPPGDYKLLNGITPATRDIRRRKWRKVCKRRHIHTKFSTCSCEVKLMLETDRCRDRNKRWHIADICASIQIFSICLTSSANQSLGLSFPAQPPDPEYMQEIEREVARLLKPTEFETIEILNAEEYRLHHYLPHALHTRLLLFTVFACIHVRTTHWRACAVCA